MWLFSDQSIGLCWYSGVIYSVFHGVLQIVQGSERLGQQCSMWKIGLLTARLVVDDKNSTPT